jgi:hypothetical protein
VLKREPFTTSQMVNVPAQIDRLKQQIAAERDAAVLNHALMSCSGRNG